MHKWSGGVHHSADRGSWMGLERSNPRRPEGLTADHKAKIAFRVGVRLRPHNTATNAFDHYARWRDRAVRKPDTAAEVDLLPVAVGKPARPRCLIAERRLVGGLPAAAWLPAGGGLWRRRLAPLCLAETYRCKGNDESAEYNYPDTSEWNSPCHVFYLKDDSILVTKFSATSSSCLPESLPFRCPSRTTPSKLGLRLTAICTECQCHTRFDSRRIPLPDVSSLLR